MTRPAKTTHVSIRATVPDLRYYHRVSEAAGDDNLSDTVRRLMEREARRLGVKREEER